MANIAPNPMFPERTPRVYERKWGDNAAIPVNQRRGPMRFQAGITTDQDVPRNFVEGVMQGHRTAPGRMNHNSKVDTKYPEETLAERAHAGSAAWTRAPMQMGEFAHGTFVDYDRPFFERVFAPEAKQFRFNPATVED